MEKLVFDYTYCDFPECWEWNIPFEYKSKEKFLNDVLYNPMMLNSFGITVHQFQVDEGEIYEKEWFENMENYIFTLEDWFERNKHKNEK